MSDPQNDLETAASARRQEKLSALSALLGPEAIAQLGQAGLDGAAQLSAPEVPATVAPDRLAWHQNRLMQRLRDRLATPLSDHPAMGDPPSPDTAAAPERGPEQVSPAPARTASGAKHQPAVVSSAPVDARIAGRLDPAHLACEHPAVIAHVLERGEHTDRVGMLRRLPGHLSRAVLRRMRDA